MKVLSENAIKAFWSCPKNVCPYSEGALRGKPRGPNHQRRRHTMKNEKTSFVSGTVDQNDDAQQSVSLANAYAALNCAYAGVSDVGLSFYAQND